jgi:two-component system, chemotaxis family, response regulator Rcp1
MVEAMMKTMKVLMVEDNRGDVVLVQEAMAKAGITFQVHVVPDGVEAMAYLRRQGRYAGATRPDLIVLDLKLPRKTGQEVLAEIQPDAELNGIPLVVLSSSRSELEIARTRGLPGKSCMAKPSTFDGYVALVRAIEQFRAGMGPSQAKGHQP